MPTNRSSFQGRDLHELSMREIAAFSTRFMAHGADMVVESWNMSDDVLFTPELIVLTQPTIC